MNWDFSGRIYKKEAIYLLFLIFLVVILSWVAINQPAAFAQRAQLFWILAITVIVVWLADIALEKLREEKIIEVTFWQDETLFGPIGSFGQWIIVAVAIGFGILVFLNIASTGYSLLGAPAQVLQVIPLGPWGELILTIAAAVIENAFFFYFLMPTIAGCITYVTKQPILGFVISCLFITPILFMTFHMMAYGLTVMIAMTSVFIFGLVNSVIFYIIRNPLIPDIFHIANNTSIILLNIKKVGFFILTGG